MINVDYVIQLYQYFYKSYFKLSKSYKFKPTDNQLILIQKFLEKLLVDKSIGYEYLWKYFIFQFNYYSELELTNNYGKMNIQYILGPKSIKRWEYRDIEFDFLLENNQKVSYSFFSENIVVRVEKINEDTLFEISKKKKFLNTNFGFTFCLENTNLFNSLHLVCRQCIFNRKCKTVSEELKNAKIKTKLHTRSTKSLS